MNTTRSATRFLAAALCLVSPALVFSQATNSGDIRGTVQDSTGALVPDATVTVTNINTGIVTVLHTNKAGLYDTSSIVVGTYSVTFEKPGFQKFERPSISLQVGTSTVNAQLKVGSESETVTVNTDLPLLNTESGSQQSTFEAKSMAKLPNVGQDWQNFTILIPGASGATGAQGQVNPGQEVSVNGSLPYSNVLADGASTTLSHSQNSDVNVFETVQELQISTSAFSAQYGIGGIIFNQISKGGTSQFHGSAYDYFQSSQFDANNYQFAQGGTSTIPFQRYNNFGGSIGGPVAIPHTHLRDKAFFYFNYDQTVNHATASGSNDIPTVAVMGGSFAGQPTIYDPTTQVIGHDANGNPYPIRKSFQSEYGSNAIPTNLFDTVAANFQKFYPTPTNHIAGGYFTPGQLNAQGQLQHNFFAVEPQSSPQRRFFGRFDYNFNDKNRLTLSVTQRDVPDVFVSTLTPCPIGCQNGDVESYNSQATEVWTISPKAVNELRLGYTYQGNFYTDQTLGTGVSQALGWQFAKADTIPNIQFVTNYPYAWIQHSANAVYKEHVFDPSDVVTLIKGKHVLHFGGEALIYQDNSTAWGNADGGTFQFSGQYTQNWTLDASGVAHPDSNTGADYADFLLGYAHNWSALVKPENGGRLKSPQLFIQDDYKVRPNLTLNLGLRYQMRLGWSETHGNEATYDPSVLNPANNKPGAYWYGVTHANGRTSLQNNNYTAVLPRVGFSYLPNPRMTIRGGFGLYGFNLSLDTYGGDLGNYQQSTGNYSDNTNGVTPAVLLGGNGNIFGTNTPLPFTSASTNPARFNGQSVGYTPYDQPTPTLMQYNMEVQQEINSNMSFNLAYVGSHGYDLQFPTDLNQIPTSRLSSNDSQYRPNLNYNSINGNVNSAISNYNSLQATIDRRLSRGLSLNFNYTWAHFLDSFDSSGWGSRNGPTSRQQQDAASNYSNSNFDIRNAFKGRIVYELPFGYGRMFLNHNAILDRVLGGYTVSSTMQFTSGNPFSVFATAAQTYADIGSNNSPYPNYTGLPLTPAGGHSTAMWYNPAAFSRPADGTFGNVRRNSLYGPGLELVNISAGKTFDIFENLKLQIRLDANNAFNHASFGQPNGNLGGGTVGQAFGPTAANAQQITGLKVGGRTLQAGARIQF